MPHAERGARTRPWVPFALSWSAGFVDAACYLRLNRTYTSHMTGNTATLGARAVDGNGQAVEWFLWVIFCFTAGAVLGASLHHAEQRHGVRSAFALVLGLEIGLLALFVWLNSWRAAPLVWLAALPAAAMGLQTVTVTRVGSLRVYTTYLTGSLASFSESLTHYLFWAWDRLRGRFRQRLIPVLRVTPRLEWTRHVVTTAGLWATFCAGAGSGAAANRLWGAAALVLPMVALAAAMALDLKRPTAFERLSRW